MGDVEFRVLGPIEVLRDGEPVAFGRGKLVDLLARLLVSANDAVAADVLVDTVWYERPPMHPQAALHNGISRLRGVIGGDVIETLPHGYRICANAEHLDMLEFDRLVAQADQSDSARDAEAALAHGLGLWRGQPLRNAASPMLLNAAADLTGRYLDACERWAGLCLELGRYGAVAGRLAELVKAHPLREQMASQLMLALYRSGRQAEALITFDDLRVALVDEMGIDPSAKLRELQMKILRADPSLTDGTPARDDGRRVGRKGGPAAEEVWDACVAVGGQPSPPSIFPSPRQIPPDLPDFCGRDAERAELIRLLDDVGIEQGRGRAVVISGKGGIGKTALAVQVAHRVSGTFRDGQLFADLNGAGLRPVPPQEVLGSFLLALGVAGPAIPQHPQDRVMLYRSLTADRRLLVVLDNAASESQLRSLLPTSANCAVIATSRTRMTTLAGARSVNLDVLDESSAVELLSRIIGRDRAAAEAENARELAALCGGLPLALRIVGARLAAKTHWPVAKLAERLAGTRRLLTELTHGDLDVRASFALSYQSLDSDAQAMLRRTSLLDAPDFPAWAGAALLNVSPGTAEDICERLVDAQLLDPVPSPKSAEPRYCLHDLVRAFASELAVAEPVELRAAALARAFGGRLALDGQAHRLDGS